MPDYLERSKEDPLIVIQVEHIHGVNQIDEILAVAGVDIICLGPNDLSGSMNKLGQIDDPEVAAAIDTVAEKVRASNRVLGVSTFYSPDTYARWMQRGVKWINLNVDLANLFNSSRRFSRKPGKPVASDRNRQWTDCSSLKGDLENWDFGLGLGTGKQPSCVAGICHSPRKKLQKVLSKCCGAGRGGLNPDFPPVSYATKSERIQSGRSPERNCPGPAATDRQVV